MEHSSRTCRFSMLSGDFAPQFPIELIEKDFSYAVKTAAGEENAPCHQFDPQSLSQSYHRTVWES